jgi:hypothetical protein
MTKGVFRLESILPTNIYQIGKRVTNFRDCCDRSAKLLPEVQGRTNVAQSLSDRPYCSRQMVV